MSGNITIIKNSILLYGRLLVTMALALYTSRVILAILGESNFGIFNVVGGVVILFSFITSALTSSTQRFLNYHIEKSDVSYVQRVFSTCTLAHIIIALGLIILGESIGLWFVHTQLNIPLGRETATMWVYQMTLLSSVFSIITVPYRSSIIASEKMSIFAMLSVIEAVLRLGIVLILKYIQFDLLIIYAILYALVSFIIFISYILSAKRKLNFCKFNYYWDKSLFSEVLSFSGWYVIGGVAMVSSKQGINILLNIAFGVVINAASGIANQVRGAVNQFISSFQLAFNPRLVKLYALDKHEELFTLLTRATKYSYYLLIITALPLLTCTSEILHYWLTEVPQYTTAFTRLVLISALFESLSVPLWTTIGATGKIKKYHLIVSLILLFDLPIVYIGFKLGANPIFAFVVALLVDIAAFLFRVIYLCKTIGYNTLSYFKLSILPSIIVTLSATPIAFFLYTFFPFFKSSFGGFIVYIISIFILLLITIYVLGINNKEKSALKHLISNRFRTNI